MTAISLLYRAEPGEKSCWTAILAPLTRHPFGFCFEEKVWDNAKARKLISGFSVAGLFRRPALDVG